MFSVRVSVPARLKTALVAATLLAPGAALADGHDTMVDAVAGAHRSAANIARNEYRNPIQTLRFFGLTPDMTVVEIWPGRGWYTEVLAAALPKGKLYAASWALEVEGQPEYRHRLMKGFEEMLAGNPEVYGNVEITKLTAPDYLEVAPAGSADMVVTFRNVHNWAHGDHAADYFGAFYRALKPGGVLGVVEHRAQSGTARARDERSGYMTEAAVIGLAEAAGFRLAASSEVNANPLDTADHPRGVWTLPPSLRLGEENRDHYLAIGESDRMTLKFVKPE